MTLKEFSEQDKYCREQNTPEGKGCDACPAKDRKHCADALSNLCGKFLDAAKERRHTDLENISRQLEREYGIRPYHQLGIMQGFIELP